LAFALTAGGRDRGQFMFLDELQPGMQGICKTVVRGDEISTFNFEIVDIIWLPRDNSMILTRMWGDAITESGGIAAGMSGSPCYIDNKLIGALFAVYVEDGFHDIASIEEKPHALVQPIEYMLQVLDTCEAGAAASAGVGAAASDIFDLPPGPTSVTSLTGQIRRIEVLVDRLPQEDLEANDGTLFIRPLASPVMVGGLGARAFAWMANGVDPQLLNGDKALFQLRGEQTFESFAQALTAGVERRYGLKLYPMAGSPGGTSGNPADLEPGGPIGVALMLGDVRSGALGTLTYKEGNYLIAFGHPFLSLGTTDLPMNAVSILDTIKNVKSPFKLGFLGEEIGAISEDRPAAIGGAVGDQARMIQFNIEVTDRDSGRSERFDVRSVSLPDWHWYNLFTAGIEAIDGTIGRIGQGTLVLDMTINGMGMPKPLQRHEIFVSDSDISGEAMADPSWIDYLLAWNEFADPQINSVDLKMTVEKGLKIKVIEGVEPGQQNISAGSRLRYTVTLRTYRGPQETISGYITIPQYASGDYIGLEAFPARDFFWKYEMYGPWVRPWWMDQVSSLGELIKAIEDVPTNGLLIVTAYSLTQGGRYAVYAYDLKPLGDWYVDGDRTSEGYVQVR
jgi:hypothetical protein